METTSTRTVPYLDERGDSMSDKDSAAVDDYAERLLSGQVFRLHAASARSLSPSVYEPPLSRRAWSRAIQTIGLMAAESDALAQVASQIIRHGVNLYGTKSQGQARIYEAASMAIADGYSDVIGRTGPGAGRAAQYERRYSIGEVVLIAYYLNAATAEMDYSVSTVGWCCSALRRAHNVHVPAAIENVR